MTIDHAILDLLIGGRDDAAIGATRPTDRRRSAGGVVE
jgi:hypothetical protein